MIKELKQLKNLLEELKRYHKIISYKKIYVKKEMLRNEI